MPESVQPLYAPQNGYYFLKPGLICLIMPRIRLLSDAGLLPYPRSEKIFSRRKINPTEGDFAEKDREERFARRAPVLCCLP